MATRKNNINASNIDNLRNKSSIAAFGMDSQLSDESEQLSNIIQNTILTTKLKIGERTNGKPINYFNEINFGNAFSDIFANKSDKSFEKQSSEEKSKNISDFKQMMVENNGVNIGSLLAEGTTRTILFNNYRIINKHIPECAHALEIYKDNIMSPDDFTKLIFNVNYNRATNVEVKEIVEKRLSGITTKYELEDKCDKIIGETLLLGESYQAVLSLEDEMNSLLNKTGILNESTIRTLDKNVVDTPVLSESLTLNENEVSALNELYNTNEETKLDDKSAASLIAKLVNERVEIGSSREFLLERMEADRQLNEETTNDINISKKKKKTTKEDQKALGVNGFDV